MYKNFPYICVKKNKQTILINNNLIYITSPKLYKK